RVHLQTAWPEVAAAQEFTWKVDRRTADLTANVKLKPAAGDAVLAEWAVPAGVTIADVTGPLVRTWSQNRSRLQVWFQPAAEKADVPRGAWDLVLTGRSALTPDGEASRFDLPCLRYLSGPTQRTTVAVSGGSDLAVTA